MGYPPPGPPPHPVRPRTSNQTLLGCGIAVVAGFLLLVGCGVGAAMGKDPAAAGRPTATETVTEEATVAVTAETTVTVTATARAAAPQASRRPAPRRATRRPAPAPQSRTDPHFGTCREANAAGYGPYRSGVDPEYDWYTDRDHDGVVCET
ncbi:MAG: hypothetical protein JWO67_6457 [Streptosporangiaceae bacterium]|nr:hypothetical protein [Streptosporangiaceae bacterium]